MNFYNLNRSKVFNIYPIHIRSYSKGLYDVLEEKQTLFGRELSSNIEKSNILVIRCVWDMAEYSTVYLIIVNKKMASREEKMIFIKNWINNSNKRNGETFKNASRHPKKILKVLRQKLRSVFCLDFKMIVGNEIARFWT